ncbi:hypothetical protein GCM10009809_11010 [Isoptericola hypogeus]|uniref:Uncharacterized protein n=1 Tax=Isoptericola hypogeus TaxID=300179 RepID=A0ABN2J2L5_9MICO
MPEPRDERPSLGWYAYAPLSGSVFVPRDRSAGEPAPAVPEADRLTVMLMNDYGADWPVWMLFDPDVDAAVDAAVDDTLAARLRAWAQVFDEHYHYERGWDDRRVAAQHRAEGEALRVALAAVLPAPLRVRLAYWETNGA